MVTDQRDPSLARILAVPIAERRSGTNPTVESNLHRAGNTGIKRGELQAGGFGKLHQIGVGGFCRGAGPRGERGRWRGGNESTRVLLHFGQSFLGIGERKAQRLHGDADETKLDVGAGGERGKAGGLCPRVEVGVFSGSGMAPRHQRVDIQQVFHGKSARAALMSVRLTVGRFFPPAL